MNSTNSHYQADLKTLSWQLRLHSVVEWSSNIALIGVATAACWGIFDLGGVLPWTQWGIAVLVMGSLLSSTPAILLDATPLRRIAFALPAIVLFGCFWAFLQQTPIPIPVMELLSPGSAEAYKSLTSLGIDPPNLAPISLSPNKTRHWISIGLVIATSTWIITTSVRSSFQVKILLWVFVLAGTLLAAIGLFQQTIDPTVTTFGYKAPKGGYPFGTYINRNNAALILNLSVASVLALVAENMLRHSGRLQLSVLGSRVPAIVLMLCLIIVGSGLLLNGSRGGVASCIVGIILTVVYVPRSLRPNLLPPIAAVASVIIVIAAFAFNPRTDSGLVKVSDNDNRFTIDAMLNDARFAHWPDGFRASKSYFPAGAGLGAYRYAYLPFIDTTPDAWYHHADNLWLEWFTELGFAALVILATFLSIQAFALARLRVVDRPMDFGLGIAGVFGCAALLSSQFFDFGVLWPGAGIMAATLFAMTIGRAALADSPTHAKAKPLLKQANKKSIWLTTIMMAMLAPIAITQLAKSAEADYLARAAKTNSADKAHTKALERSLSDSRQKSPQNADLQTQLASNEIRSARRDVLAAWGSSGIPTSKKLNSLYPQTSPQSLRNVLGSTRMVRKIL